jgi:branched-chain amino acid transport system ATP-binding protein
MLEVEHLHAYYGEAHILRGVSLKAAPGHVLALLGRNGMGKTTLIRSVMGLAPVAVRGGTIRFRGAELRGRRPHAVAALGLGLVPQGRRLFPSLSVAEHLAIARRPRGADSWDEDKVYALFPRLAERRGHRGNQLSGGERQMLAIGRALMTNPELVLMDEPSEGLAPIIVAQLEARLQQLKKTGMGILLVEQNMHLALAVADDVTVLEGGRVVYEAPAEAVRADVASLRRFLGV